MSGVVHVEITGQNVAETAKFYEQVFGFTAEPSPFVSNYTLLSGSDGPLGAVMSRAYQTQPVIVWFSVDDIEGALDAVQAAGGSRRGSINSIPGQGRVAYAADINGTVFGIREPQSSA